MLRSNAHLSPDVEGGMILLDSSRCIIALDPGATTILKCHRNRKGQAVSTLEPNILKAVEWLSDPTCQERVLQIGLDEFICRTYALENQDESLPQGLVALLLEKHWKTRDAIDEIGVQYRLTKREQQAIRGLSAGLSTKALAATMNIKPSTLRAFLRLIKIKMGVLTRADIMVKILQRQP
jgi:DNA-binding CsgD family transcriptional regulator